MDRVVVVTVTYGARWQHLSEVLDAVIHDIHLERLIIVDNGSKNKAEIEEARDKYGEKIEVIRMEHNIGSAGGFAQGLKRAREIPCEFVLMLDDDNVPEPQALGIYVSIYKSLSGKRVVCGYRPDIQDESVFRMPSDPRSLTYTFFDVWSMEKVLTFTDKLLGRKRKKGEGEYRHIVRTKGFVYGGAFLPVEAVREAPLPDKDLVLYGDDVEYSWGVLDAGYTSYLSDRPIIRDVDMSFDEGDHILGLFDPATKDFKVYYRIRNMVRISRRNSLQSALGLHSSIFIWILGLLILGLFKYGPTRTTFSRMKLISQAVYGGYVLRAHIPHSAHLP